MFYMEDNFEDALNFYLSNIDELLETKSRTIVADIELQTVKDYLEDFPNIYPEVEETLISYLIPLHDDSIRQILSNINNYLNDSSPESETLASDPFEKAVVALKTQGYQENNDILGNYATLVLKSFNDGFQKSHVQFLTSQGYEDKDKVLTLMSLCRKYLK